MEELSPDKKLFRLVSGRMFSALSAFYIWKWLNESININVVTREVAEENVEVRKKYPNLFSQLHNSCFKSFVLDLSVFFDAEKYEDNLSLGKLLKVLEKTKTEPELNDIKEEIKVIKNKHGVSIKQLLDLRNEDVAHQKIEVESKKIKYKEIEELFKAVQEILNIISRHYDDSTTIWYHIELNIEGDMSWVFDNLKRGEKVRIDDIHKEHNMPINHEMNLNTHPFEQIKKGSKKIEVRLYDEKRRKIQIGDIIEFTCDYDKKKIIKTRVVGLLKYDTFEELIDDYQIELFGYSNKKDLLKDIFTFYTKEQESKYGVLGIKIV